MPPALCVSRCQDCIEEAMNEDGDLQIEGARVLIEIAPFVKVAQQSQVLESSPTITYLNITTKENIVMCIRLTICGYEVVGDQFDTANKPPAKVYELIDQLLNDVSPAYRDAFSESLICKLTELQKGQ
ncbi:GSK3-beta interaction protein-like [Watersipora subatra]|uniref:GSK3-beta interaction protein-like n=1 Tax=Watersipora subatra TaxID=2589382 RepID=UPI00355B9A08